MLLPQAYFDLQLRFATRAAAVLGRPLEDTLLTHTTCYRNFGLGRPFDPADPTWRDFVAGFRAAPRHDEWTYRFYRAAVPDWELPPDAFAGHHGCFSFNYQPEGRKIRLHFHNRDRSGAGALSRARLSARRAELRALFAEARREAPEARTVRGNSWLYNLDAYRRLFPPEYTAGRRPAPDDEFQFTALWGQFLDHRGQVKEALVGDFLRRVARARTPADLAAAFPFQVLETECAIAPFHPFYDLGD